MNTLIDKTLFSTSNIIFKDKCWNKKHSKEEKKMYVKTNTFWVKH